VKDADDEFDDISQKDDGYIKLVLRVLARMCDGQHAGLQVCIYRCTLPACLTVVSMVHQSASLSVYLFPFTHDSIYAIALYAIARPSVRLSHGWISQRRLKLGSCNFQHTVAP